MKQEIQQPPLKIDEIQKRLKEYEPHLRKRYNVSAIGLFGSYVRGEARPDSDVDVLIELDETAELDLLDLVSLQNELTDLLQVKVDVALKRNLRKRIGRKILQEAILL